MLTSDSDTLVVALEPDPGRLIAKIATSTAASRGLGQHVDERGRPPLAASAGRRVRACCRGSSGTDGWPGTGW